MDGMASRKTWWVRFNRNERQRHPWGKTESTDYVFSQGAQAKHEAFEQETTLGCCFSFSYVICRMTQYDAG